MPILPPRLVVAGTHSGVGKTTVATGLMAALRRRGVRVASAKVGPDFIDPGYHGAATGRPGRNLDAWMSGAELIAPLAGRAGEGADVLVVEGVMGLFDGAADGSPSSTADVAHLINAPVVLVIECAAQAASAAATVHGFASFDRRIDVAGVVLNGLAGDGHEAMVREAIADGPTPLPVLGALHRDDRLKWRDRHLGLVPVAERPTDVARSLDALAAEIEHRCDIDAQLALARRAPGTIAGAVPSPSRVGRCRIAVARGAAFTFAYPDNDEALAAAGAELVPFDPLTDSALPADCAALVVGGGFPEVMAAALAANTPLRHDVRQHIAGGMVTWAECAGLLWLARSLDGAEMVCAVDATATMTDRLTLGYREAATTVTTPLGPVGTQLRGHEFHYSTIDPAGPALEMTSRFGSGSGGFATPTLLASYLHVHLAARPDLAEAFVRSAVGHR